MSTKDKIKDYQLYNVEQIMVIIENQLKIIFESDPGYYSQYDFILKNEQMFVKNTDRQKTGNIYIVVKFLPADINYNQNIVPITITAVSEYNNLEVCQRLLMEYAQTFNLVDEISDDKISYNQTYTTPQIMSSFNEVFYGYRSTFLMSGTFFLSYNSNYSELYYISIDGQEIPVDTITFSQDFSIQLDTQPFFNTNNFTKSIGKFGTHVINFTIFLTDNELCNLILDIVNGKVDNGVENTFKFKIKYNNGQGCEKNFKLSSFNSAQNIGEMPIISCVFTN